MRILSIRHITLAVRDLDGTCASLASLFGAEAADAMTVAAFGARTQDLALGESTLQLVSPVDRDGALQRFIERRGEGVYTVALEVDDLDAAIGELAEKGVRVSAPVDAQPGMRTAFVAMSATHGMSVQLIEDTNRMNAAPEAMAFAGTGETANSKQQTANNEAPMAESEEPPPPPKRALDLTPDEWEQWSDVD